MRLRGSALAVCVALVAATGACSADTPDQASPSVLESEPPGPGSIRALPDLTVPRAAHTATALPRGRVLITGGCTADGCEATTSGTELYDPRTRTFEAGPKMSTLRAGHTATALPDGRVLIVGGYGGEGTAPLATAEIFDPATDEFQPTAPMSVGRGAHAAVALEDGRVLVVGGVSGPDDILDSAEIFDPDTQRWSATDEMTSPRSAAAATVLADGRVLVTGGQAVPGAVLDSAEMFDPDTGRWAAAGILHEGRYKHASSLLDDGRVLVVGGSGPGDSAQQLNSTELFDPASDRFQQTGSLGSPRFKIPDAVVTTADGKVVVAGGAATVEVYDRTRGTFVTLDGLLPDALSFSTATLLEDGAVLVAGGYSTSIEVRASARLVEP